MKLFAAAVIALATVAGSSAFAMNAPLTASIAFEVTRIVPGADLSALTSHQIAQLNGLFANPNDQDVEGTVKRILKSAQ